MGLKFLIDENDMCSILTTVYIPEHTEIGILRQKLREKKIIIYEGKGCFQNRVFQVGNIGKLSFEDIQFFLDSLDEVLLSFLKVQTKEKALIKKTIPIRPYMQGNIKSEFIV